MGRHSQASSKEAFKMFKLLLMMFALTNIVAGQDCCTGVIKVTGDEAVDAGLAGDYAFKEERTPKPNPDCYDGCIYNRDGNTVDEYCFQEKTLDGMSSECEAASSKPSTETGAITGTSAETGASKTSLASTSSQPQVTSTEVAAQAEAVKNLAETETDPTLKATLVDLANVLFNISATLKSFEDLFRSRQFDADCSDPKYCELAVQIIEFIEYCIKLVDQMLADSNLPANVKEQLDKIKEMEGVMKSTWEANLEKCDCKRTTMKMTSPATSMTTMKTFKNRGFQMRKRGAAGKM